MPSLSRLLKAKQKELAALEILQAVVFAWRANVRERRPTARIQQVIGGADLFHAKRFAFVTWRWHLMCFSLDCAEHFGCKPVSKEIPRPSRISTGNLGAEVPAGRKHVQ